MVRDRYRGGDELHRRRKISDLECVCSLIEDGLRKSSGNKDLGVLKHVGWTDSVYG